MGNIVGFIICNMFVILGVVGVLVGLLEGFDVVVLNVVVMIGFLVGMIIIVWIGFKLTCWEGAMFLIGYVSYFVWFWLI